MRHLALLALILCLVACSEAEINTQIVISVATDYDVPEELDAIKFRIEKQNGKVYEEPRYEHTESLEGKGAPELPLTLAMTSVDAGRPTVRVTVQGFVEGKLIVQRQAVVGFRTGQTLSLPMNLLSICESELCEEGVTTCGDEGSCEPVERRDLGTWTGRPPGLDVDAGPGMDAGNPTGVDAGPDGSMHGGVDGGVDGGADAGFDGAAPEPTVLSLAVGYQHSCAVMRSGRVYCWGGNSSLQLGSATSPDACPGQSFACSLDPQRVPGIEDAIQVTAGEAFTCALTRGGEVWCWGSNDSGQLGGGSATDDTGPTRVRFQRSTTEPTVPLRGVDAVSTGRNFACARVAESKSLVCWGGGTNELSPIPRSGVGSSFATNTDLTSGVERFALGHFHGCYTDAAGALSCWGWNASGQLGLDPATLSTPTPNTIFASKVTEFALGDAHTCAIVDGSIRCVGLAFAGQLGIGPVPTGFPECYYGACTIVPQGVDPGISSKPLALALGAFTTCARYADGRVGCWGNNDRGQAGQPPEQDTFSPQYVPQPRGVRLIAAFAAHVCIATEGDEIFCWGNDREGQLGPNGSLGMSAFELSQVTIVDAP